MKKTIVLIVTISCMLITRGHAQPGPPPSIQWQRTYGGILNDILYTVQQTTDSGYILGGRSTSEPGGTKISANFGNYDYWLVRLDANGTQLWDRSFGGHEFDELHRLQQTTDGGFILGGSSDSGNDGNKTSPNAGDFWVIRVDSLGNKLWEKTYGGSGSERLFDLHQTSDGGFVLAGPSSSSVSGDRSEANYGNTDFWVIRIDGDGNKVWDKAFGTASNDDVHSVRQTANGGYILGGTSSSGASGNKSSVNYGGQDFWLVRLDSNGNKVWDASYGGAASDDLYTVLETADGGFITGGYSDSPQGGAKTSFGFGGVDFWVVRVDANGSKLWDRSYGGDGHDNFQTSFNMSPTFEGGYILSSGSGGYSGNGNKQSPNYGANDAWLVRIDANGSKIWDLSLGANDTDVVNSLQQTADGGFIVGATSYSDVGGNKSAARLGGADYWVVKVGYGTPSSVSPYVDFFVAPNGLPTGDGTREKPWDLQTAINPSSPVKPGDTVFLRGGNYTGNYTSWLKGNSNHVITLRGYRNEHVTIDGYPNPNLFPLTINGAWTIYRNFEVTQSSTWNSGAPTPVGIQCVAPQVKIINVTVHDAGQGIGFWSGATNSELYGCIIYHNGLDSQEHGIYTQNEGGTKIIHDNIIFNNSGFGVHAYTTASQVRGFDFQGNIAFNSGAKFPSDRYANLFIGGFPPSDRITVISNHTYTTPSLTHFNVLLSDRDHSSNPNGTLVFRDNWLVGGSPFTADDYSSVVFSNNFLLVGPGRILRTRPAPSTPIGNFNWDANTYYGPSQGVLAFALNDQNLSFESWRATTTLDDVSTYRLGMPTGANVFVRANRHEAGRGHVVVYNWDSLDTVAVDLSMFGLAHGQRYEVRNVQNYIRNGLNEHGAPVESGIFDTNNPVIAVHMKTPEARAVADPGYPGGYVPSTTLPQFGVFVVAPPTDGVPVVLTPPLAHWKFDETSGLDVLDSSGNSTGTLVNGPTRAPGKLGGALLFDGIDDYVNIPTSGPLDLGNRMSISIWFKPSGLLNASSGRRDLLKKFTAYWLILNYPWADGKIAFVFNGGSPAVHTTTTSWQPDQWYHLVATYDGSNMRLYVNGVLEAIAATATGPARNTYPLQFGGNSEQAIFFPGALDEVRLYSSALPAAEILNLYRNTIRTNSPPVLSTIANQSTLEDIPVDGIPFTAFDNETPADDLEYAALSSNSSLIPNQGLVFGGLGTNRTLRIVPAPNQSGSASITVSVRDPDGETRDTLFAVGVTAVNDAPTISAIADQTVVQGFGSLVLNITISDPDSAANSLEVVAGSSNQTLISDDDITVGGTGASRTLTLNPAMNQSGSSVITVTVMDPNGASSATTFTLTVNASNNVPTISAVSNQTVDEDNSTATLAFTIGDVETPPGNLSLLVSSSNLTLVPVGNMLLGGAGSQRTIRVLPAPQQFGEAFITLVVTDGHNATATNTFLVTVRPVNDPPTIGTVADQITNQGQPTSALPLLVGDVETLAANLILTAASSHPALVPPANVVFGGAGSNRTVRVTPVTNQVGTAIITLSVDDGESTRSSSFILVVQDTSQAPTNLISHWRFDETSGETAFDSTTRNNGTLVLSPARVPGKVGSALQFNGTDNYVNIVDSETLRLGNNFTVSLWFKPTQTLNQATGRKDMFKKFVSYWLIMNYPSNDGRLAFVLNSGSPYVKSTTAEWLANQWYHVAATYDGANLRLYVNGNLQGAVASTAVISRNSSPVQIGGNSEQGVYFPGSIDDVRLYITPLPANEVLTLYNSSNSPNTPPSISDLPNQTLDEDQAGGPINFTVGDTETAAASLAVTATSSNPSLAGPGRLTLSGGGATRTLTINPAPNQFGSAVVTVMVADSDGGTASDTLSLTVNPVNDLPTISALTNLTILEDTNTGPRSFTISDQETSSAALTLTVTSSNQTLVPVPNVVFGGSGANRTATITPVPQMSGESIITITVTDGANATATSSFLLTVSPVNDLPTISDITDRVVEQDHTLSNVLFTVGDVETAASELSITFTSSNHPLLPPANVTIVGSGASRSVTLTPAAGQFGTSTVAITVTDGDGAMRSDSFVLTITRVNSAPSLSDIPDQATSEDTQIGPLDFTIGDDQTALDSLVLVRTSSNPTLVPLDRIVFSGSGALRSVRAFPATNETGSATITVTVRDAHNAETSDTFVVHVSLVDDSPILSAITNRSVEQGSSLPPITFVVTDPDSADINLSATSSNSTLVPINNIVFGGSGLNRTVTIMPESGQTGSSTITIFASDGNSSGSTVFELTVVPTNAFPTIAAVANRTLNEDTTSSTFAIVIGDAETPLGNLVLTAVSSDTNLVPQSHLVLGGTGADRTLTLTPGTNQHGTCVIALTVSDERGATASRTFVVTIDPINDPPTISALGNITSGKDQPTSLLPFTVGDVEMSASSLTVSGLSSNPTLLPPANISFGGTGSARTVQLTPAPDQSGSVVVTVQVSDGDALVATTFTWTVEGVAPPPPGIISHWKFDETSGLAALDASGPNPGTLVNGPVRVPGKFSGALALDGINDYVNVPDSESVDLTNRMTISLWLRPGRLLNSTTGRRDILTKFVSYWLIMNYPREDGRLTFVLNSGFPAVSSTTTSWLPDQWYHIAATYDAAVMRLYVNGVLESSTAASVPVSKTTYPTQLGGNTVQGYFFPGILDEVQLYGRALLQGEVQNLFQNSARPNTPPTISTVGPQTLNEDAPSSLIPFAIGDQESAPESLTLTVNCSNLSLLPAQRLVLGGTGANRTLTLWPATNQSGSATVTLLVTDPNGSAVSNSFLVTVAPVNDLPTISDVSHQTVEQDHATASIPFTVADVETPAGALTCTATSSDEMLVPLSGISFAGTGPNRSVTITPAPGRTGASTIWLTVRDADNATASDSFVINVTAVNAKPTISPLSDIGINEDSPSGPFPVTVGDSETPAANLVLTAHSENSALVPLSGILLGGTEANRVLSVTPSTNQFGTALLRLVVTDAQGGSASNSFVVTVNPVNDSPVISDIADQATAKNQSTPALAFTVGDPETIPTSLSVTSVSSNPDLIPASNIVLGGTGPSRTARIVPATNQTGTALITLTVSDGEFSVSASFLLTVQDVAAPVPGLISHWTLDEPSGLSAFDLAGNFTGTLVNGPLRVGGITSGALLFDGLNDYVNIPDADPLDLTNRMSISLWFKPSRLLNSTTGRKDLFKKFVSYWLIMNYPQEDGRLSFVLNSGFPLVQSTRNSWNSNQWHQVVATYDGATMKLYIDGALDTSAPATAPVSKSTFPVQIGGNTEQGLFFPGTIDEVRLYGVALTPVEVTNLFNAAGGSGGGTPVTGDAGSAVVPRVHRSSGKLVLTWDADPRERYQVQHKKNLLDKQWADVGPVIAVAGAEATSETISVDGAEGYFRVLTLPERK